MILLNFCLVPNNLVIFFSLFFLTNPSCKLLSNVLLSPHIWSAFHSSVCSLVTPSFNLLHRCYTIHLSTSPHIQVSRVSLKSIFSSQTIQLSWCHCGSMKWLIEYGGFFSWHKTAQQQLKTMRQSQRLLEVAHCLYLNEITVSQLNSSLNLC